MDVSKLNNHTNLGIIICGFSGIGKTTLGKKYENVAEIGQSLYRNIYEGIDASKIDREQRKNITTGIKKNPNWPDNYINKINELRQNHDLVLVFTDFELMNTFREKIILKQGEFLENYFK